MKSDTALWATPREFLMAKKPDHPVSFFCPRTLQATARNFADGFPGLVTYAVKANPNTAVITNLQAAGIQAFDVASPQEIDLIRTLAPMAALHYNNPVRSLSEIEHAVEVEVRSFSVDCMSELRKLQDRVPVNGTEISVRLKLPVKGAAYDFGEKFGADADTATLLLKTAADAGFKTSLTFHPGTQCMEPSAWTAYIKVCAEIAKTSGVRIHRLNVGGGFPTIRRGPEPQPQPIFDAIRDAVRDGFGEDAPALICEPGRAMSAEAFSLAVRVKSIRDTGAIYLNDGIYGGLTEFRDLDTPDRFQCFSTEGELREGPTRDCMFFGPTCDSLDKTPDLIPLPENLEEEDYIIFRGMGAYVHATATRFNGYGDLQNVTVNSLRSY